MVIILVPLLIIITFLLLLVIVLFFFTIFDLFLELPYVGAKREMVSTIIKLAQIKKVEDSEQSRRARGLIEPEGSSEPERPEGTRRGETVVDLGSGDGRLLIAAAKKGAKAIGYEINPFLIAITKIKWFFLHLRGEKSSHLGGVIVKRENLWKADLAVADVIFVYAKKKTMKKFEDFIFQNARKGTRVIVNTNPFPNIKPQKALGKIFLYKI